MNIYHERATELNRKRLNKKGGFSIKNSELLLWAELFCIVRSKITSPTLIEEVFKDMNQLPKKTSNESDEHIVKKFMDYLIHNKNGSRIFIAIRAFPDACMDGLKGNFSDEEKQEIERILGFLEEIPV